jgi:hypothetical protein
MLLSIVMPSTTRLPWVVHGVRGQPDASQLMRRLPDEYLMVAP